MKRLPLAVFALAVSPAASGQEMEVAEGPSLQNPEVETYTVSAGDTLWDISDRIVGSPWLWPQIWAYNPELTNPHWIYPGDQIRFFPDERALPNVDLAGSSMDLAQEELEPETIEAPRDEYEERPKRPAIASIETAEEPRQVSRGRRFVGLLVTEKELQEAGTLTNAVPDKVLLSAGDYVFLTFPDGTQPSRGTRYMLYKTLHKVWHPESGEFWGYMTAITGFVTVFRNEDGVSRAKLTHTYREVERGQYVTPHLVDPYVHLTDAPAQDLIKGQILAVQDLLDMVATHQIVFVDKGQSDGLAFGNRLIVSSRGGLIATEMKKEGPLSDIASLVVVDAKETTSTCLVLGSRREVKPGDRFRTRFNKLRARHPATSR